MITLRSVLEHVHDAAALGLVVLRGRRAEHAVVLGVANEGSQTLTQSP